MSVKEALLSLPHVICYMCKSSDGAAFREALCIECVCLCVTAQIEDLVCADVVYNRYI